MFYECRSELDRRYFQQLMFLLLFLEFKDKFKDKSGFCWASGLANIS